MDAILSLDDYKALEETSYLLHSPKNARRLLKSLAELGAGGGTERDLAFGSPSWPTSNRYPSRAAVTLAGASTFASSSKGGRDRSLLPK